jgi:uncharacterized protein YciI
MNTIEDDFFPVYSMHHSRKNRADRIRLKKQKIMILSGPDLDADGEPQLPLSEEFVDALKGAAIFYLIS